MTDDVLENLRRLAATPVSRSRCPYTLGDARCGITPPAGATCAGRLATCVELGNARRFGGVEILDPKRVH